MKIMATITNLDLSNLAAISGLVVSTAGLLLWLRLNIVSQLLLASARVMVQVLMLGIFATLIFQVPPPIGIGGGMALLLLAVSITTSHRLGQIQLLPLIGGSLLISTTVVTAYVQFLVIQPPVWYSPPYLLALVGILVASSPAVLVGVGQQFFRVVQQERLAIETRLSLGATANQAIRPYRRAALQQGLLPVIQTLAVTGLITIPTFMAALMMAGIAPLLAATYQIVVLLMVLVHQILTAILVVQGLSMYLFGQHQLLDRPKLLTKN
jgi:putative ABC transport system permease protein